MATSSRASSSRSIATRLLLDIGFKSEAFIPSRELSIRHDVDAHEIVSLGDEVEALVLQKETRKVASSSPKSVPSTTSMGHDREDQRRERLGARPGHRGRQRWPHPRHRPSRLFLPPSSNCGVCADLQPYVGKVLEAKIIELDKNRNNSSCHAGHGSKRPRRNRRGEFLVNLKPGEDPKRAPSPRSSTSALSSTSADGRSRARLRALLEARRSSLFSRASWR